MSTSGTVNGTTVAPSEGSYIDWQLASQNIGGNYSTINWQAGWRYPARTCRGLRLGNAFVAGSLVYNNTAGGDGVHAFNSSHLTTGHDHSPKLQTASGSINVGHNSDGTLTLTLSVSMRGWDGGSPSLLSNGSGSFSVTTIPRFSSPPSTPAISSITDTSFDVTFSDGGGGAAIDARYIAYGTDPSGGSYTLVSSDGSDNISGLTPGTVYYIWAKTHNVAGDSGWSGRATATTLNVPDAPTTPVLSEILQTSVVAVWAPNGDGGSTIIGYEIGYGTDDSTPDSVISATSPKNVGGLDPGIKYYFWVRAINAIGTGPWSASANAMTIAGARVNVAGVWTPAIPYVRDGGTWKIAQPYVRTMGEWKQSI